MADVRTQIANHPKTQELISRVATFIGAGDFAQAHFTARDGINKNRELFKVQPMSNKETIETLRDVNARLERRTRQVTTAAAKVACLGLKNAKEPEKVDLRRDIIATFELIKRK
jgi:hypothetical protein